MIKTKTARYSVIWIICLVFFFVMFYISLTNGAFHLSVLDIIKTFFRIDPSRDHDLIVFQYRLPRIVLGALVGMGLGVAGSVIQGITRNNLADPGILGINAGAGAAIVLFMFTFQTSVSGENFLNIFAMPLFGLVGGGMAAVLIYVFARYDGRIDPQRLLLIGIAVGSGFSAIALYLSLKMNPNDFEMASVWLAGSIWGANWKFVLSMLPWLIVLIPLIMKSSYVLNLFQLGETTAKGLGVATKQATNILLLCSIGIISACVSVSGNIGFVGLISPHLARRLAGSHHQRIVPLSGMIGMLLVMVSDFIAKTVFSPVELPVGIVIAIIGVPYFVYLLVKMRQ